MSDTIKASTLRSRRHALTAETMEMRIFRTRGPNQRDPCWNISDKMAMIDTVMRGMHCGPIYIIEDLENNIDDVFDGAHRCEAVCDFMDNKFAITKSKGDTINWDSSPLREFVGKQFKDLPKELQEKIKKYTFYLNIIDPETVDNSDALSKLWERLSTAGKPLNKYEAMIMTYGPFLREVLKPNVGEWLQSVMVPQAKSNRGSVEMKLCKLLALSEKEVIPAFSSLEDVDEKWCDDTLGRQAEEINAKVAELKNELNSRLKNMRALLTELQDNDVFYSESDGKNSVQKTHVIPLVIIIGRMGHWFTSVSRFKRCNAEVCAFVKAILQKTPEELTELLDVNGRNAKFQKALINHVDTTFRALSAAAKERRAFTPAEKKRKLEEQSHVCPLCNMTILEHQRAEGDHIVEYSRGGPTSYENLQMVHKKCHEAKNRV